jgi:N-acetyl sugar amidotransferase
MYSGGMKYCSNCVYPIVAAHLEISDGICSACKTAEGFNSISNSEWEMRAKKLTDLLEKTKSDRSGNYDCIVPVSGGKDSYYQVHKVVKDFGLKPLLVTYHGNNYLPEGDYNRDRMREVFDADHLVMGPSVDVLKKLNILGFKLMGDMNWHAHCGIYTYPIQIATKFEIPLIIWGEIFWDISGMFSPNDYVEFSARVRHEHALRGFEWTDMVKADPTLNEKDLLWAKYPNDDEILHSGVRGICIGNYFKWDPNVQADLMIKEYGWRPYQSDFQRTYRKMSNLDDRYENGVHDYLKFVKFGYGRGSDHASKDIRTGYMSRQTAVEMVKKYDHVIPDDLYYWLEYVSMTEEEFWAIADTFRDPRVWWIEGNEWWKDNIWGEPSSYGPVHLDEASRLKFKRTPNED